MAIVGIPGVNLNEVDAWDGSSGGALPPGEYVFEVTECIIGNSSKGNSQLELDLVVVAGAVTDAVNGATKKHWVVMTEKSAGRVRNMLDACGVQMNAAGAFDSDHFKGTQFIGEVYEDSYDKPDLSTGQNVTKITSKIRKERPVSVGFSDQDGAPAIAPAAAPAPQAPAPAPAAPAAPARPLPPGPRVAGAGAVLPRPGMRAPIPGRRA